MRDRDIRGLRGPTTGTSPYHRFAIPGGDGMHRETTIDKLTFTRDGAIVPTLESVKPQRIRVPHCGGNRVA
jgi:hypothetical protein